MLANLKITNLTAVTLLAVSAAPLRANHIASARATVTCTSYCLRVRASELVPGKNYVIDYTITLTPVSGSTLTITDSISFTAPSSGSFVGSAMKSNSIISFTANGTRHRIVVPDSQITFSPTATCSSTTFDSMTNTWMITVPVSGDDEIFLSGLAFPVPSGGLPGGINPVTWTGTFGTSTAGISMQWKWGAAVYSSFTTNYNQLGVKAGHQTACGTNNGDHAGTPEGVNNNNVPWQQFVVGGARGGGGANFTGSWSGTVSVTPVCSS